MKDLGYWDSADRAELLQHPPFDVEVRIGRLVQLGDDPSAAHELGPINASDVSAAERIDGRHALSECARQTFSERRHG